MLDNSFYNKELLEDDYYPNITAYYFREWKEYEMAPHSHNRIEIMYVISGKCNVEVVSETIFMKNSDFILIDSNVSHKLIVNNNMSCRMLNIEFEFEKGNLLFPSMRKLINNISSIENYINEKQKFILLKDTGDVYSALKNIVMDMDEKQKDNVLMVQLLLCELLIYITRQWEENLNSASDVSSLYVKKAIRYLKQYYDYDVHVDEVASHINLHPGYLQRIFKVHTGDTIMEYLTKLRIEKAKMLLVNTDIPIIDISSYIGINSRQYFTFIFKKYTGISPMEFRKNVYKFEGFD